MLWRSPKWNFVVAILPNIKTLSVFTFECLIVFDVSVCWIFTTLNFNFLQQKAVISRNPDYVNVYTDQLRWDRILTMFSAYILKLIKSVHSRMENFIKNGKCRSGNKNKENLEIPNRKIVRHNQLCGSETSDENYNFSIYFTLFLPNLAKVCGVIAFFLSNIYPDGQTENLYLIFANF